MVLFRNYWLEIGRSVFGSFGLLFLIIESYEVLSDRNLTCPYSAFLLIGTILGGSFFLLDGYYLNGFLKKEVTIPVSSGSTKLTVKFGDIFAEPGWKAIGVNDFFDSKVDGELVSPRSLHGHVIRRYWDGDSELWAQQIAGSIKPTKLEKVQRTKGNCLRYPIGTTAKATKEDQKFLFVALTKTNPENHVAQANVELLICAVRGLLQEARAACSYEPLVLPLMGSALARVGVKNSMLVDLIIAAIQEETLKGQITREINIVLPVELRTNINLKNYVRNWKSGV
jgi:hypothetical protein